MATDKPTGLCTNVLLRWLLDGVLKDDAPAQRSAARSLLGDRNRSFFVNNVVIAETVWILRKKLKLDKTLVADLANRLLAALNIIVEDEAVLRRSIAAYLDGPADLADELIAHINQAAGCATTVTFDRDASGSPLFTLLA